MGISETHQSPSDVGGVTCPGSPPASPANTERWILSAAILGSSMAFIDGTVVNVALPALQRDLGATAADAQWVVEAYALSLSALILVGGALGDRLGRRRMFTIGVVGFAAASVVCGVSPNVGVLIGARALQGVAGALLTPGSLSLISAGFDPSRRGRAIGTWAGATSVFGAIGPLGGGFLIEHLSWRWAFLINVPIALVTLILVRIGVPESRDDAVAGNIDWPGAVLVTAGLGLVVYALIEAQGTSPHTGLVGSTAVVGVALLVAFGVIEARSSGANEQDSRTRRAPMVPLGLFRSRPFSVTNLLTLLLYAALGGALFFVPVDLQENRGFTATQAGGALIPLILLLSVASRFTGALVDRVGARVPLTVGPAIAGAGFLLLGLTADRHGYLDGVLPGVAVLGVGMALTVAPLTSTVMGSVDQRHAGTASGINNAVARTAGLVAIAVFGLVLTGIFSSHLDGRLDTLPLPSATRQQIDDGRSRLALLSPPASLSAADQLAVTAAVSDAFVDGFRDVALLGAVLAWLSAAVAFVGLREPPRRAI